MIGQYLVIGVGRFGSAVARTLYDLGHEVVAVDRDEAELQAVMGHVTHAAVLDATDERALDRLGLAHFEVVIVAIGDDLEASILATVGSKAGGARYVIAKANDRSMARILATVGADEIVRPEHDMGARLAMQLASPSEVASLELGPDNSIVELDVRDLLVGTLETLRLPARFGVQVLAVHRGRDVIVSPGASFALASGDRIVVIGKNSDLDTLREHLPR
ncbi:potassium channel family protein [Ilumatobacter coccineus]|jgi:trk/ktr system potassium uptake protein|uniref:Ktr system potassium uptake protein KtrA n=1 Tax=Ilumatobacter coccineus (strain NBRC 103263 / KCTC 29153 / YM16-304) TaxID=1313172 RepID=A0A6C7EB09_ILUCY|nr:TrkA family potassium uptake protein [Ilumatobacter coccineus]BAN02389.1 Ktr system potassium uptake protein KtrA [Ilumatobacter coccineus YM16-304]